MADYTNLTESEKQEIVKAYNRKYAIAVVMQVSSILSVIPILLVKDYFNIPHKVLVGMTVVFAFLYLSTSAYRYTLSCCPICGRSYGSYRKFRPAQCPGCKTYLGSLRDMVEPDRIDIPDDAK